MIARIDNKTKTLYLSDFELTSEELIDIANRFPEFIFKYEENNYSYENYSEDDDQDENWMKIGTTYTC